MANIKKIVTALISGKNPAAIRVKQKERERMSDERFRLVLRCIVQVAMIAGTAAVLITIDTGKLIVVLVAAFFLSFLFLSFRDL